MELKNRLGLLRRQAGGGAAAAVPAAPPMAERLARLRAGSSGGQARARGAEALAERLGAVAVAPGCLLIERRLPFVGRHGAVELERCRHAPAALPGVTGKDPRRWVLLDTETTGLSGGSGTAVFLLGVARIEAEALVVRQFLLTAFAGEPVLLGAAADWLAEADAVVTYNGRTFDIPLLATRCRLAGVTDRFSALEQIDLLHPTRRAFARRWPDCRLVTVERELLRFRRHDDLPGSEAPAAWLDFLHAGDAGRLPGVVEHNRFDLVSLAALMVRLDEVYAAPAEHGADLLAVALAHRRQGEADRCERLLRGAAERPAVLELARLHRRRREWQAAVELWLTLAEAGEPEAIESLAKYYEHVARDPLTALDWAQRLPKGAAPERRRARLAAKCAGGALFAI